MIELSDEEIKGKILYNIRRKGQQYINKREAVKGFPPHMIKTAQKILENMVKEGLLKPFKKNECVGANMKQKTEIMRLIKIHLEKRYSDLY